MQHANGVTHTQTHTHTDTQTHTRERSHTRHHRHKFATTWALPLRRLASREYSHDRSVLTTAPRNCVLPVPAGACSHRVATVGEGRAATRGTCMIGAFSHSHKSPRRRWARGGAAAAGRKG